VEAPVRWRRFDTATYALGREEITVEALRAWLRRPGAVPSGLLALAGSFPKAEPALREALRILL